MADYWCNLSTVTPALYAEFYRIGVSEYMNTLRMHIRKWYYGLGEKGDLELRPTKKGMTYDGLQLAIFYGNIPEISRAIQEVENHRVPDAEVNIDEKRRIIVTIENGTTVIKIVGEVKERVFKRTWVTEIIPLTKREWLKIAGHMDSIYAEFKMRQSLRKQRMGKTNRNMRTHVINLVLPEHMKGELEDLKDHSDKKEAEDQVMEKPTSTKPETHNSAATSTSSVATDSDMSGSPGSSTHAIELDSDAESETGESSLDEDTKECLTPKRSSRPQKTPKKPIKRKTRESDAMFRRQAAKKLRTKRRGPLELDTNGI